MKIEIYEKLRNEGSFETLWFDLLKASGFAGCTQRGGIVDRRYYPKAFPVHQNNLFGVAKPKEISTKKKIYIAGKISGEDVASCTMKFGKAQKELEQQGFEVLNPLEIVGTWKITWEEAMKKCISALITADALVLLHDFKESKGAMIEEKLASDLNMRVFIGTRDLDQRLKRKDD